jgi:hypothetical protein
MEARQMNCEHCGKPLVAQSESTRLDLPAIIGPNTEMVQEISALVGKYGNLEGAETNCDVVSSVLNAAKRYLGGERE